MGLYSSKHASKECQTFESYFPFHSEHLCNNFLHCVTVPISDNEDWLSLKVNSVWLLSTQMLHKRNVI